MSNRLEVEGLNARELRQMMKQALRQETAPLREEVRELKKKLHEQRRVITHKEAPAFFNHEVTPETVVTYIKERGLEATKRGRIWFIELEDLFEWQSGGPPGKDTSTR